MRLEPVPPNRHESPVFNTLTVLGCGISYSARQVCPRQISPDARPQVFFRSRVLYAKRRTSPKRRLLVPNIIQTSAYARPFWVFLWQPHAKQIHRSRVSVMLVPYQWGAPTKERAPRYKKSRSGSTMPRLYRGISEAVYHKPLEMSSGPVLEHDWASLLAGARQGNEVAIATIIDLLGPGLRFLIARRVEAQSIEDVLQDTYTRLLAAIGTERINTPAALPGYAVGIARRVCADHLRRKRLRLDREGQLDCENEETEARSPLWIDELLSSRQIVQQAQEMLTCVSTRQAEVLRRFYVLEQSARTIQAEMGLSPNQFRMIKWRAKARFAHLVAHLARPKPLRPAAQKNGYRTPTLASDVWARRVLATLTCGANPSSSKLHK